MTRLFIIAAAALTLSACGGKTIAPNITVVSTGVRLPVIADADMTCGDQPAVPARQAGQAKRSDSQVQRFILDLRNWGAGCKDKLDATRNTWRATEAKQSETDKKVNEIQPK